MARTVLYRKTSGDRLGEILSKGFIARSEKTRNILRRVRALKDSRAATLICGESGTGKELVARMVHDTSLGPDAPFVAINCAALPEGLLESELFGHRKGSFTGAINHSPGLFRQAHGGTLFLDEIGDMPISLQAKLLRVLQEGKVRPVGGGEEYPVNVRVISASHQNLMDSCARKKFRMDLYFRLSVIPLLIPSLRERKEEILPLAKHHVNRVSLSEKKPPKSVSKEAEERLISHTWPGNVRELNNVMERALIFSPDYQIKPEHIIFDCDYAEGGKMAEMNSLPVVSLKKLEELAIRKALKESKGVKTRAARKLGIDRKTLLRKAKDYGLEEDFDSGFSNLQTFPPKN